MSVLTPMNMNMNMTVVVVMAVVTVGIVAFLGRVSLRCVGHRVASLASLPERCAASASRRVTASSWW